MRIGVNLLYLIPGVVGGTETYATGLLHGFSLLNDETEFVVFVNQEATSWRIPSTGRFRRIVCDVDGTSRIRRYAYEQFTLHRLLGEHRIDILHSLGYTAPLRGVSKSIVTIHDLNYHAFGNQLPFVRRIALGWFVERAAKSVDHVITVSHFSKGEITKILGIPDEKVTVTYEAPHPYRNCEAGKSDTIVVNEPYWVAFSSESPNKNLGCLLQAMQRIRAVHGVKTKLVLIGHMPKDPTIRSMIAEGIVTTGFLDDEKVSKMLSEAQLLIFPSKYEGFGLPVVEAMACGVPVVCSNAASLPEIAGTAAVFFDPSNIEQMAEAIVLVANSRELQNELREKGFINAAQFSWEKTAVETLGVYRQVLTSDTVRG